MMAVIAVWSQLWLASIVAFCAGFFVAWAIHGGILYW